MGLDLNLEGKKVAVIGGTRGIGRNIAETFCSKGSEVSIIGKNIKNLSLIEFVDNNHKFQCDITDPDEAEEALGQINKQMRGIDTLVCNVGSGESVSPGEENFQEWERMFLINFFSATNAIEKSKEFLIKSKGSIICISSICGLEVIENAPITYSVAKSALNMYVKSISKHLGKYDVRINAIALGNIFFNESTWDKKLKEDESKVNKMLHKTVPLKKFGKLEDVSNLTLFLASSISSFATGSIWTLDGGQLNN